MASKSESLRIMIVTMGGEQPFGVFSIEGNRFTGVGNCGTRYSGTFTVLADGATDVVMAAIIPEGTRLGSQPPVTEERHHQMNLHLSPDQAKGKSSVQVLLPGFGRARIRLDRA